MADIQASSRSAVIIAHEAERGYVPPRRHGVDLVARLTSEAGLSNEDVLIVQADADTRYQLGYVESVKEAARSAGPGILLEGRTEVDASFLQSHAEYQALADGVDGSMSPFLVGESDEVIVDDKVCSYFLSDYEKWGGHRREFDPDGEEIHAETSRLFIRGKACGAQKLGVDDAIATPSRRKVLENPGLYFATCGFPHGVASNHFWKKRHPTKDDFEELSRNSRYRDAAIFTRKCHDLILFGVLPIWVSEMINPVKVISPDLRDRLRPLATLLPKMSRDDMYDSPGRALWRALKLIETQRALLRRVLEP